ncbi:MAG TPA: hypothetical protein VFE58_07515 [Tepidisphaeraceae bacterium]|jgi:4-amino-4-deoxy-L-arabinose transferase-like glycosyltransferase|nr:hypothetical protein [Tepidisphaeraceae bacterium]
MTKPLPSPNHSPSPLWTHPGVILSAFLALILLRILTYAGRLWPILLPDLFYESLFLLFWLTSATLTGSFLLRKRNNIHPVLYLTTSAALGLGLIGLATLVLGLAGLLTHITVIVLLILLPLPKLFVLIKHHSPHATLARISFTSWLPLLFIPFIAITLTGAMIPPGFLWKNADDPHPYDVLEYHLQIPREWYEAGRILPLQHNVFSYFPMNAEMHSLLAMHLRGGPWEGMYLAQLMSATFMALAILSLYGICRTLGASRFASTSASVLAAITPWTTLLAPVAYVESAMLLYATLAIGWALIAAYSPEKQRRWLTLSGALAGLACGVKYTAVPMLLLTIPLSLLLYRPKLLRPLTLFLLAGLLTFSPWLIRNTLWSHGNPIFPEAAQLLGRAHFSPDQIDRWEQAHSPRPDQRSLAARAQATLDQILLDWRYGYTLLPLTLIATVLAWRHRPEIRLLFTMLLLILLIWLFATHLQSRFFILAIPLCALLVGLTPWESLPPKAHGPRSVGFPNRIPQITLTLLLTLTAFLSYLHLNQQLTPYLGLFGITDFKPALSPAYTKLADEGHNIALIGQGQIFWYQLPMTRLSYRTVFDVDASHSPDPITPWLPSNPPLDQWLLIYPSELQRFSKTYAHIPAPPASMLDEPEPIVVPPK